MLNVGFWTYRLEKLSKTSTLAFLTLSCTSAIFCSTLSAVSPDRSFSRLSNICRAWWNKADLKVNIMQNYTLYRKPERSHCITMVTVLPLVSHPLSVGNDLVVFSHLGSPFLGLLHQAALFFWTTNFLQNWHLWRGVPATTMWIYTDTFSFEYFLV